MEQAGRGLAALRDADIEVDAALEALAQRARRPHRDEVARRPQRDEVARLQASGGRFGLSRQQLECAAALVAGFSASESESESAKGVLKAMLPRGSVSRLAVVRLVGALSGLPLNLQAMALKWLVIVNRQLSMDATRALQDLYGVLFYLVDLDTTRAPLCRLLYMLTRRCDVTRLRVLRLSGLVRDLIDSGQHPGPLLVLYDLYAQYAPEEVSVVPGRFARAGSAAFFREPDKEWSAGLERVAGNVRAAAEAEQRQRENELELALERRDSPLRSEDALALDEAAGASDADAEGEAEAVAEAGQAEDAVRQGLLRTAPPRRKRGRPNKDLAVATARKAARQGDAPGAPALAPVLPLAALEVATATELGRRLRRGEAAFPEQCSDMLRSAMFRYLLCVEPREEQVLRLRHALPHMIEDEFFSLRASALSEAGGAGVGISSTSSASGVSGSGGAARASSAGGASGSSSSSSQAAAAIAALVAPAVPVAASESLRFAQLRSQAALMEAMAEFADFMQQTLPEMDRFLVRLLETWNGVHHVRSVLRLLSRLAPRTFADLHREVLRPLHRIFGTAECTLKARILGCLTELVRNWAELDWEQQQAAAPRLGGGGAAHIADDGEDDDDGLLSEERQLASAGAASQHRFAPVTGGGDFYHVVSELVAFVDKALLAALIAEQDHPLLQVAAGHFFKTVADLHRNHNVPFVVPPSPGLTFRLLLAPTPVGPSVACGLLLQLKDAFKALRANAERQQMLLARRYAPGHVPPLTANIQHSLDKVAVYNSFVLDACNALWIKKPLPKQQHAQSETNSSLFAAAAQESGLVAQLRALPDQDAVARAFSVTHSAAFAALAHQFCLRRGVADPDLLDSAGKAAFLDYLEVSVGCSGLAAFMRSFISSLAKQHQHQQNEPRQQPQQQPQPQQHAR
jgi:hypothetical protein